MKQLRSLIIAALTLAGLSSALAQSANNNLANRFIIVPGATTTNGTTAGNNRETNEATPGVGGFPAGFTAWYEWTAPSSGAVSMTANAATYRIILAVWTGSTHPLSQVVAVRSGGIGQTATANFTATAGVAYKVMIDCGTFNNPGGEFTLTTPTPAVLPIVNLTTPTGGQIFTNPTPITLTASATSGAGTVTNVSYYYGGGTFIGSATTSPFTFVWNNPPVGNFPVYAQATDTAGGVGSSASASIVVRPFGYFNIPLIGFDSNNVWKYGPPGDFFGTGWETVGYDDDVWPSGPSGLGVDISANGVPIRTTTLYTSNSEPQFFRRHFNLSVPTNGVTLSLREVVEDAAVYYLNGIEVRRTSLAPADNPLTAASRATASITDPTPISGPFSFPTTGLVQGDNVIAVVVLQSGAASSDIELAVELTAEGAVNNASPTVALTAPADGAFFNIGTNITITATANDTDGTVTNVAFYHGATKLGDDATAPYEFTWTNVPQGVYTLTARATDDDGTTTTSAGRSITVNDFYITQTTLVPTGSVWRYLDNGTDQGTAWTGVSFNDTAWSSGPAQLGYGEGDEATVVQDNPTPGYNGPDTDRYITTYFRHAFVVNNAAAITNLTLRLLRDDGAVVYINGVEVRRDNLPVGPIDYLTVASAAVSAPDETTFFTTTNTAALNNGTNIVAVEIHQNAATSSDVSFEMEIIANVLQGLTFTNSAAPFVQTQSPVGGSTVPNLTAITVTFSESVSGVSSGDLLVNGTPATGVVGGPTAYTFTFPQPALGTVNITWAGGHGIVDQDLSPLPFDGAAASNTWSYTLSDLVAPTIIARSPAGGATITNLTQINVTFSEPVANVNAGDMLINGSPASGLTVNSSSNYTFTFGQPQAGTINISWQVGHGITDLSPSANAFNGVGAGATWSYTLTVAPTILVASNSTWRFFKGLTEASSPVQAWRAVGFNDSTWGSGPAPFYYGDPYGAGTPLTIAGGQPEDMQGAYQSVYLRRTFTLVSTAAVVNFIYRHQIDDGLVAWINGVEVLRVNMAASGTDPSFQPSGVGNASEAGSGGAFYVTVTNTLALGGLIQGTNVLAVQACNQSVGASSDFGFNLQFEATIIEINPAFLPPRIFAATPPSGDVFSLSNLQVTFSEPVDEVTATDLLINGVPASGVSGSGSNYTFTFTQPAFGPVSVTWAVGHGIEDTDVPPKPFDGSAPGASFSYSLINPSAPTIVSQTPLAASTVSNLTQIQVSFSEAVQGVNASDLLVAGTPATGVSGSGANYTFTFAQPPYGNVAISWAGGHGITDTEVGLNAFDPARPGGTWNYTLVDLTAPTVISQNPAANASVTNLTQLSVTFSEAVTGVNAGDLLINGVAATGVSGGPVTYTFTFAAPNTSIVNVNWITAHGITDTASPGNSFNATGPGATWQYITPDTVAPTVTSVSPPPGATIRDLTQIVVTFAEPVAGVNAGDLIVGGVPASTVSGSAAGPYTFGFTQPATGVVEVLWVTGHGITDLGVPPNPFAGGEFNYILNPNAVFADKIVINEIFFHPSTERTNQEWIELHNTDTAPVNIAGWRLTKGVNFTFPNVSIPAGGYLVVAASAEQFLLKYPGVTNVIGDWTGMLNNTDEEIQLETATGEEVDAVHYADGGDWAIRQRGPQDVANANPLFNRGWEWFSAADGVGTNTATGASEGGRSLELRNPRVPNQYGQNWTFSTPTNGTPGVANSALSTNIAPMVLDVAHFPPVPTSADFVTITARVRDEQTNGHTVTLFRRNHTSTSPGAFVSQAMFDDGLHNDGLANDGVYGAVNTADANGTVIEFYVRAVDAHSRTNTWPAPARQLDGSFQQTANALYQVDNEVVATNMPYIRLVLTGSEQNEYYNNLSQNSDAEMNCTFISIDGEGTKVRYLSGMRIRGAGSRGGTPKNNRVNFPSDNRWNGRTEMNFNNRYTHIQTVGSALALKSGLPVSTARPVQYRLNGVVPTGTSSSSIQYGAFVQVEPIGGEWAENHYPNDGDGNVYRASTGSHNADFTNFGTNGAQYIARGYTKTSNGSENDWADMNQLTLALQLSVPDNQYVAGVNAVINVTNWMRYFAVCSLLEYSETSLCVGRGDDYAMYRGVVDPRFTLVAHDFDTVLGYGDSPALMNTGESIWAMVNGQAGGASLSVPVLPRFVRHPSFVPIYFAELKRLADTVFAPTNVNPLIDQLLRDWAASSTIPTMQAFADARTASVLSQIPLTYSLVHTLALSNGVPRSTAGVITLRGAANAIDTRTVRVNGQASTYSAWEGRWTNSAVTLQPGYNNLLVEFAGESTNVFTTNLVVWYDTGSFNDQSGTLGANVVWSPGAGPYRLTAAVTVPNGGTLTIQPGTTVYLNPGVSLNVANGGRLLAEGTPTAGIQFLNSPGPSNRWGGIVLNGSGSSPESRIAYAYVEGNNNTAIDVSGAAAIIDHVTFGTSDRKCLDLDAASFVVSHCYFPNSTGVEPVHGTGGIRAGGRGVILRNFFGKTTGYNDTVDFTGGNRPSPILHVIDNVFTGSDDDILDLDGTDAWVQGNIFLHAHRNGSPDSASAVSGGSDTGSTSEITVVGNLFYDVDQAATAKQGNFYNFINNTVVRQSSAGFDDAGLGAVLNFADDTYTLALGMYAEGNIFHDIERLTRYVTNATALFSNITFHNNLMPLTWTGTGTNNSTAAPLLTYVPALAETTNFTSWQSAQVLRSWLAPRSGSPALGSGPNGRDKGGVIPFGASISGEPGGTSSQNTATLRVGPLRTGNGIPSGAAAFPAGSGFTHYKWRLDLGPWSSETPTTTPITLAGLSVGSHRVDVVGKLDTGLYQDDTNFAPVAQFTASRTWTVDTSLSAIRINEILAANSGGFIHSNTTPDAIELYNASSSPVNLEGMRLTDDPANPDKFTFPAGTIIPGGGYLVVFADNAATPGIHLGFSLSANGESLHLYDSLDNGGPLLDSITFGLQLDNLSVGRLVDGSWNLCQPTLGSPNVAAGLGDPRRLKINEWLAIGLTLSPDDFVEIYNLDTLPVALGGLYLTDEPNGWPTRHTIAALSFIAGGGYRAFTADGNTAGGAEHLNFGLSAEQGMIGLLDRDLSVIDCVVYLAQHVDIAQGRSPNGSSNVIYFAIPTPGAPNQSVLNTNSGIVINEVLANNQTLAEPDGTTPDWIEFHNLSGNTVDISDMSVTDNTLLPRRYVFAPGTTIGPVGYLRLRCDPDAVASATNTGFGLKSTGGSIYLFDKTANGGGLVSAVSHGLQTADYSIGRVPNGSTNWVLTLPTPAFGNAAVSPLGDVAQVKINEWMAAPSGTGDDWFELYNPNAQPVAVGGMYLTDTLANRTLSQIPALSFIGAGDTNAWQRFWADGNPGAGADHVNFSLRANGEAIGFSASASVLIDSVTFPAQQTGVSEGRFPDGNVSVVRFPLTPSPGDANFLLLSNVVINEALAHTDVPLEDAIELRNLTASPLNIGNWWLSDAKTAPKKYRIPNNTTIPANGYIVFYEYQFNADTNDPASFSLSSGNGDEIYLSQADTNGVLTGFRTQVDFDASQNGVSFGRYVTSDNRSEFVSMSARSFGQDDPGTVAQFRTGTGLVNPYPKVGPVVISQIMYHPPDIGTNDNSLDEFIELKNISASAVPLYDTGAPTNTWRLRDAVDFNFPSGLSLPAGSNLLVVSFDPVADPGQLATFRGTYGIPSSVPVYGPYTGKLANNDDDVELQRPDAPNPGGVPYVLVERVHYYDLPPWPQAADGSGFSLNRVSLTGFGNDPTNWLAAAVNFGGVSDTDGDGMPNWWENQFTPTLNPNVNDAGLDPDGDGMTNLQEYLAGTNPTQFASALRFTSVQDLGANNVRLTFFAVSNKTYAVQFKTNLTDATWATLTNITAATSNRTLQINSSVPTTNRFYRLRTP